MHLADLNAEAAEAVARQARQAGGSAEAHAVDVADPAAEGLAKAVCDAGGRIGILHNNASIGHAGNIEATTIEDWQQVIGVNLLGAAYGIQAFMPRMLTQGRPATIVNTASRGAERRTVRAGYPRQRGLPQRDRHSDRADRHHARPHAGNPGPGHRHLRQARHATRNGHRGHPARDPDAR
jgi:NAD(P)-dependent dehydrogenase (short-subunit alcohol dehydrogenase family)